jgi:membrane-associated protein
MNIVVTCLLLIVAAILGDLVNYHVGKFIGHKAFSGKYRFLKKEYLERTQEFYYKHGGKTIIYARFIPIIRTFAPFVAGIGTMTYLRFASYNVIGGNSLGFKFFCCWVFSLVACLLLKIILPT